VYFAFESGPAHGFPNNWKFDGDYPPAGGQRNSFFAEFTSKRRGATKVARTSKSAVSRVSKPAAGTTFVHKVENRHEAVNPLEKPS
jgi:hypothetical protein